MAPFFKCQTAKAQHWIRYFERQKAVTKSELIACLAKRNPQLAAKDADFVVDALLNAMSQALCQGQRIEIRGFGSFSLNERPMRMGRNPKSGDQVLVQKKYAPHFRAGKELRERVDAMAVIHNP